MHERNIDYDSEREMAHIMIHIFNVTEAQATRLREDKRARGVLVEVTDPRELPAECLRGNWRLYTGFEFALLTDRAGKRYEWRRHLEPLTALERERLAERIDRKLDG